MSVVYTADVTSSGDGRKGTATSADGVLDLRLAGPKEVGGSGDGTNPEQLFAAGWGACFHSALRLVARNAKADLTDSTVTVSVDLVKGDDGYHLAARIVALLPGLTQEQADDLVAQAHARCPYSKATRGNIDVEVTAKV
ncbi:organic hydroperoxide resistance protein [Lentzea aerocolonigenes]|uniref:Organic hydroperoxide resistance protein n=1 Tax=Lentzea aerocolonigenes TaxID=68170 RepID=A0A0F0GSA4_LENAE|nr:organic hydroperoxide resistance protein [Lentzea aerocolonigenes]KJK46175.1 organic hydroperoxide resistance protein [Lentzea aerocolonigenes]